MMSSRLLVKSSFNTWLNPNKLYPGYYNLPSYLLQKLDVFQALLVVVESPWLKQSIYLFQMTVVDSHYVPMISPCLLVKSAFCCWSHPIPHYSPLYYHHIPIFSGEIPNSFPGLGSQESAQRFCSSRLVTCGCPKQRGRVRSAAAHCPTDDDAWTEVQVLRPDWQDRWESYPLVN